VKKSLLNHPKLHSLAGELGISLPTAVGHLCFLWAWGGDYACNGIIGKFSALQIAQAAQWQGDSEKFISALITSGFVDRKSKKDGKLQFHDWSINCEEWIRKRIKRGDLGVKSRPDNGGQRQILADNGRLTQPSPTPSLSSLDSSLPPPPLPLPVSVAESAPPSGESTGVGGRGADFSEGEGQGDRVGSGLAEGMPGDLPSGWFEILQQFADLAKSGPVDRVFCVPASRRMLESLGVNVENAKKLADKNWVTPRVVLEEFCDLRKDPKARDVVRLLAHRLSEQRNLRADVAAAFSALEAAGIDASWLGARSSDRRHANGSADKRSGQFPESLPLPVR
jgi:hypothetical protein